MYGYFLYREFLELKHHQPTTKCDVPSVSFIIKLFLNWYILNLLVQT